MSTSSDLEALRTACTAAIQAGDYETAENKAMQAQALLATVPDQMQGPLQIQWRQDAIQKVIDNCRHLKASSTGIGNTVGVIQRQSIIYERESC